MNAKDRIFKGVTSFHRALFEASNGRVASKLMGMPVVLLTTTGRTSGKPRKTMLTSPLVLGDVVTLVASYGGDDREPAWCRNLRVNPDVSIVMGGTRRDMRARIASAEERAELWPKLTAAHANYGGYQEKTTREIPLVLLEPVG